jgi:hypothetical protein
VDSIPGGQLISTDITSRGSINFEEPDLVITQSGKQWTR